MNMKSLQIPKAMVQFINILMANANLIIYRTIDVTLPRKLYGWNNCCVPNDCNQLCNYGNIIVMFHQTGSGIRTANQQLVLA